MCPNETIRDDLKVGEWYTCYSAGFWQLMQIHPKYVSLGDSLDSAKWNKGDLIGQWCIMKKAFTPKMKKSILVEFMDSGWLKPVPEETLRQINRFFQDDPAYKSKFDRYDKPPDPMITNFWITLTDATEAELLQKLPLLPSRFTMEQFRTIKQLPQGCIQNPPTTHLLNFFGYPWDLTDRFDEIYTKVELIRMENEQKLF